MCTHCFEQNIIPIQVAADKVRSYLDDDWQYGLEYIGAMEVLTMDLPTERVYNKKGYIMSTALNHRTYSSSISHRSPTSSPNKRGMGERAKIKIRDVVLIDITGIVIVSMWGRRLSTC